MNDRPDTFDQQRSPEGAAITDFILAIFRVNGRLLRAGDNMTRDLGLTSTRWQILNAIVERPKTVAQIARDYELTRQGISWVVQSMAKDRLVELIKNPDHRRAKLVRMTAEGHNRWQAIAERQLVWSEYLAGSFDKAELVAGLSLVERLGAVVQTPDGTEGQSRDSGD